MPESYVKYVYIGLICMVIGVAFYYFAEPLNTPEFCKTWSVEGTALLLDRYSEECLDQLPQRIQYFQIGGIVLVGIGIGMWVKGLFV